MKNLNLSYVLFGVFVLMIVTVMTCGKTETKESNIEVLSFPNPEEVKEEVKEKVEEVKEAITNTIEEKVEAIETRLQEALPSLDIPALKEEKAEEATAVEAPVEEAPVETVPVEQDSTKVEGSTNE
jgi:hypothetical protein